MLPGLTMSWIIFFVLNTDFNHFQYSDFPATQYFPLTSPHNAFQFFHVQRTVAGGIRARNPVQWVVDGSETPGKSAVGSVVGRADFGLRAALYRLHAGICGLVHRAGLAHLVHVLFSAPQPLFGRAADLPLLPVAHATRLSYFPEAPVALPAG